MTSKLDYDFDPAAKAPHFDLMLERMFELDVAAFVPRLFGAALAHGDELQKFALLLGPGRNGKSTLVECMNKVFGCYSRTADPRTFTKGAGETGIRTDLNRLKGTRLVEAPELNVNTQLDAATVKRLTGGDTITARGLYQEERQFEMAALVVFASNFPPLMPGADFGLRRRLSVVTCARILDETEVDPKLGQKLLTERPGILNRLLDGLREYRERGLDEPDSVSAATDRVIRNCNVVRQFVEEWCVRDSEGKGGVGVNELYRAFQSFCFEEGRSCMTRSAFNDLLRETYADLTMVRRGPGYMWAGLKLAPQELGPHH